MDSLQKKHIDILAQYIPRRKAKNLVLSDLFGRQRARTEIMDPFGWKLRKIRKLKVLRVMLYHNLPITVEQAKMLQDNDKVNIRFAWGDR